MSAAAPPFVDIQDLGVTFTGGRRPVPAVNGVNLQLQRGEVVALIGESGSGKSVTLRSLLRLHAPRRTQVSGRIVVAGHDVLALSPRALADYRGKVAAMVFQEPLLALDPVYTLGAQIARWPRSTRGGHRSPRRSGATSRWARRRRASARWRCSSGCASPAPNGGCRPIRTR
jgi:peptide/nickel transport system ATP-binding protein